MKISNLVAITCYLLLSAASSNAEPVLYGDVKVIRSCLGKKVIFKLYTAPKLRSGVCKKYLIPSGTTGEQWYTYGHDMMLLPYVSIRRFKECKDEKGEEDLLCLRTRVSKDEKGVLNNIFSSAAISREGGSININFDLPVDGDVIGYFGDIIIREEIPSIIDGVYISTEEGDKITAPESGVVILKEKIDNIGSILAIDHGQGIVSIIGGLEVFNDTVKSMTIKKGDIIGMSIGKTIYWGLRIRGVGINPMGNINEIKKRKGKGK